MPPFPISKDHKLLLSYVTVLIKYSDTFLPRSKPIFSPNIYNTPNSPIMSISSLSINPAFSPPLFSISSSKSLPSTFSSKYPATFSVQNSCFCNSRTHPGTTLLSVKLESLQLKTIRRRKSYKRGARFKEKAFRRRPFTAASSNMTIIDYADDEEENPPPLLESEMSSRPRRIALFVEPSPFS